MKCDLHNHFSQLASRLPTDEKQRLMITQQTFAELPSALETDQVVVRKTHHDYSGSRVDLLNFFASKSTYQELGLLILAVVFRPGGSRAQLRLTHPNSAVRTLIIEYGGKTHRGFSYRTRPEDFLFFPAQVERHPWTRLRLDPFSLPTFTLTNLKEFVVTDQDWANRDTIKGFGNDDASVGLAELLLRFGSPQSDANEIELEGEGGFRGVGIHSAEVAFYLPGCLAWPEGLDLTSLFSDNSQ